MANAVKYIEEKRAATGVKVTVTTLVVKAVAMVRRGCTERVSAFLVLPNHLRFLVVLGSSGVSATERAACAWRVHPLPQHRRFVLGGTGSVRLVAALAWVLSLTVCGWGRGGILREHCCSMCVLWMCRMEGGRKVKDLGNAKISNADTKSVDGIASELRRKAGSVRKGRDAVCVCACLCACFCVCACLCAYELMLCCVWSPHLHRISRRPKGCSARFQPGCFAQLFECVFDTRACVVCARVSALHTLIATVHAWWGGACADGRLLGRRAWHLCPFPGSASVSLR